MKDSTVGVAWRQHGLVTRQQAQEAGLSDREVACRFVGGRWLAVRRGVYVINGAPHTRQQAILAACLVAEGTFASHETAGWLWGLQLPDPLDIHVTTVGGSRMTTRHRPSPTRRRGRGRPHPVPGNPCHDAGSDTRRRQRDGPPSRLGAVVDDALRRKLVGLSDLRGCHARVD